MTRCRVAPVPQSLGPSARPNWLLGRPRQPARQSASQPVRQSFSRSVSQSSQVSLTIRFRMAALDMAMAMAINLCAWNNTDYSEVAASLGLAWFVSCFDPLVASALLTFFSHHQTNITNTNPHTGTTTEHHLSFNSTSTPIPQLSARLLDLLDRLIARPDGAVRWRPLCPGLPEAPVATRWKPLAGVDTHHRRRRDRATPAVQHSHP
ncbi:hypothetical protein MBM_08299 [Drepanopeziza brunnea f. sp. 'multigermtubi' MB_m1]|uniref:Uncharacterized protein n=1 Tax=Marssonina brunnea f. sp. multigermtubi (strain MB_m1) TaxID=1072389 RepID=K1WL67_MARBU|nr:uncharacterized protein MBM_08299 [Drepanopeziza brunnea f. sp. 'multigermtubi' MB_m1]EKD13581.1 hypothetical protein MBM_08299 [Drepanopeziza brunnea f. sp. 'multigermtubi' MB_m1]